MSDSTLRLGLLREGKTPPDARVALTPDQCAYLLDKYPLQISVQPYPKRSYSDQEYADAGIELKEDLSDCDYLLGIKEVPVADLLPGKTYFMFSHTIKKQAYNRKLLQAILAKRIRLIDWEVLTQENGARVIAFGRFAGMVGAHNALYTYGKRTGAFDLPRMHGLPSYADMKKVYQNISVPPIKIVLTGNGRVGNGAAEVLRDMGIRQVSPKDFREKDFPEAVFTQLDPDDYVARKDDSSFSLQEFFADPTGYKSIFAPYAAQADIFINGIFWDNRAPAFFTLAEMADPDFKIEVIGDITCDIAPVSSIPSTIRSSTIAEPVYGFDPATGKEIEAFQPSGIDIMAIDNLPNELPRDASEAFGTMFIESVLPELLQEQSAMLDRATIARKGQLGPHFKYLEAYVSGH